MNPLWGNFAKAADMGRGLFLRLSLHILLQFYSQGVMSQQISKYVRLRGWAGWQESGHWEVLSRQRLTGAWYDSTIAKAHGFQGTKRYSVTFHPIVLGRASGSEGANGNSPFWVLYGVFSEERIGQKWIQILSSYHLQCHQDCKPHEIRYQVCFFLIWLSEEEST